MQDKKEFLLNECTVVTVVVTSQEPIPLENIVSYLEFLNSEIKKHIKAMREPEKTNNVH